MPLCVWRTGRPSDPRIAGTSEWALGCVASTAKSILLEAPSGPELVAGSLNFTTSSKANAELGVKISLPAGSNAAATWLTAFEAVWARAPWLRMPPSVRRAGSAPSPRLLLRLSRSLLLAAEAGG